MPFPIRSRRIGWGKTTRATASSTHTSAPPSPSTTGEILQQSPVDIFPEVLLSLGLPGVSLETLQMWRLVLESQCIPHRVEPPRPGGDRWRVEVRPADASPAVAQLVAYERENRGWRRPRAVQTSPLPGALPGTLGVMLSLTLFHGLTSLQGTTIGWQGLWQGAWPAWLPSGHEAWVTAGAVDARLMVYFQEWYRAATALTLHGDAEHLAGNAGLGGLYCLLAGRELGIGATIALAILAGVLGNVCNALFHGSMHVSIGASTAVFGLLGGMTIYRSLTLVAEQRELLGNDASPAQGVPDSATSSSLRLSIAGPRPMAAWLRLLAPVAAGVFLLGFLGVGGENTDVLAHAFGFAAGIFWGWVLWRHRRWALRPAAQYWLGWGSVGLMAAAWVLALW